MRAGEKQNNLAYDLCCCGWIASSIQLRLLKAGLAISSTHKCQKHRNTCGCFFVQKYAGGRLHGKVPA